MHLISQRWESKESRKLQPPRPVIYYVRELIVGQRAKIYTPEMPPENSYRVISHVWTSLLPSDLNRPCQEELSLSTQL